MKRDYYKLRGWDEQGRPTLEKIKELGMDDALKFITWVKGEK
jgi:aldehyde:ferredoxin oxidoreductase